MGFSDFQFWSDVEQAMRLDPAVRWRGWTDVQVRHVSQSGSPLQRQAAAAELARRLDDDDD